jgi:hypothetical protein
VAAHLDLQKRDAPASTEAHVRVDGILMFSTKRSEPLMSVAFETGWAQTRFA